MPIKIGILLYMENRVEWTKAMLKLGFPKKQRMVQKNEKETNYGINDWCYVGCFAWGLWSRGYKW